MEKYLQELMAKRAEAAAKLRELLSKAIDESRELTEDEKALEKQYEDEIAKTEEMIAKVERQIELDKELSQRANTPLVATPTKKEQKERKSNPADVEVDKQRYSLFRAINAMVTGDWSGAEYERELSLKIADNLGREARGLFVPLSVQRDVMATTSGTGFVDAGALVGTEHRDDLFIESLRATSFVVENGARVLPNLIGNVDIPRALGGVEFTWLGEDENATDSAGNYDTVSLSPKTVAGAVPITRRLQKQSSPAVENLIMTDIRAGIGLAIDKAVLVGAGGKEPTGILNTTGVSVVSVADADKKLTFAEAVEFETKLAEANALRGNPIYVTTPTIAGAAKTTPIDSGSGIMLNTNNQINGYKVVPTTLITEKTTIFGNFNDVIIGMWGVLDIMVDTATKAASGGIVLRVFQDVDVAIRHPKSFAKSN